MSLESNPEQYNAHTSNQIPTNTGGNGGGGLLPIIAPPQSPQSPTPHDPAAQKSKWWDKCWEHKQFILELVAFAVLCAYTGFACLQWLQIKWTNKLTREALDGSGQTLQATLGKMQGQIDEMHALAGNAGTQATQTTNLVTVTRDLASWSKQSAEVELALNRPVVIAQNPVLQMNPFNSSRPRQIDGYLVLSLQNSGRLTAQDVRYKIAEGKYAYSSLMNQPEGLTRYVRNKIDSVLGDSKIEWTKIGDISFGSPSDHIIPLQLYADDDGPIYIWAGRVEYFDQFGEWQWFEFCFQVRTGRVLAKYPTTPITFEPTAATFRCPIGQSSGTRRTENKNK